MREPSRGKAQVSVINKPQHPDPLCPLLCLARDKGTWLCHTPGFLLCAQDQCSKDLVLFSTQVGRRRAPLFALVSPQTLCPGSLPSSSAKSSTFRSLPECPACPQGPSALQAELCDGELLRWDRRSRYHHQSPLSRVCP